MGFFKRLVTPDEEEAFVDGCRELVHGDKDMAFEYLEKAVHLADGAYAAGFMALGRGELDKAENYLTTAAEKSNNLGSLFNRYGITIHIGLPVTDEVEIQVQPCLNGVLLGLVEIFQRQKKFDDAMHYLEKLRKLEPEDILVKLSLAELLMMSSGTGKKSCERVIDLSKAVTNETHIHAALLLYKARALRELGLLDASRETLGIALRRKKNRPAELMKALRYERAGVYEQLGQHSRARKDLERLYSEDPGYQDVATLLGI